MSDAELIYHACLRAERRLELELNTADSEGADNYTVAHAVARAVQTIREEIGRDLARAHTSSAKRA